MKKITLVDLTDKLAGNPKDCLELIDSILRRVCEPDIAYSQANHDFQQKNNITDAEECEIQF